MPEFDPNYQRLETRAQFQHAVMQVVATARLRLDLFDPDLTETGLESVQGIAALRSFLLGSRAARWRVVLRDADYFNQRAVRLQNLLRDFSHAIEIRQLPSETPGCAEAYVYNDSGLCLYRPHAAHARAILTLDERSRAQDLRARFSELVAVSTVCASSTTLGL